VGRLNPDLSVTELTGGVTAGFSADDSVPTDITTGPDGNIWFTDHGVPGRLGRVNCDGSVTEFTGGVTPGFSANAEPQGIAAGADGNIWFTMSEAPGRVGRITLSPHCRKDS
jgi:streptogramin lyase